MSKTIDAYHIQKGPRILVFQDGKCVYDNNYSMIFSWVMKSMPISSNGAGIGGGNPGRVGTITINDGTDIGGSIDD